MALNVRKDEITAAMRVKLNDEKIKLWLPPYTTDDGQKGEYPQDLITRYSQLMGLSEELVSECLEELRCHALEKLTAKKKFEESGVATLKIKLAGNMPQNYQGDKKISLEMKLSSNGHELKQAISDQCGIPTDHLKLITGGHIIDDEHVLSSQRVKNSSQVMAICLSESEAEARKQHEQSNRLQKAREAAELLASKEDGGDNDTDNYYLQIADQTGKPLDLPKEERKALVLAMTLHERGKSILKKKDYGEALLVLLEADKEFKKCRSDILTAVDNYALVCLDIVWCYLCLKNVDDLPDAESRLQTCDECFRKSYGPNLERLALVKGGTGSEKALFMRLHLLQGILAYHKNHRDEAIRLFTRAESELKVLLVDEESMTQVMAMGFTQQEARLGLRMCEGNIQLAVSHIMKRKEEKMEQRAKEKEEKRKRKIQTNLGTTANGDKVNIDHYENLVSMGFSKGGASEALRQSNNDIMAALQVLQENPELLNMPDPDPKSFNMSDEMISQVVAMGFDEYSAKAALNQFHDVQKAIEELLKTGGTALPDWLQKFAASLQGTATSLSSEQPSTSKTDEEKQREKELIDSIISDIPSHEEDYLDLTLEEESQFLQEYKAYLQSLQMP